MLGFDADYVLTSTRLRAHRIGMVIRSHEHVVVGIVVDFGKAHSFATCENHLNTLLPEGFRRPEPDHGLRFPVILATPFGAIDEEET